MNKRQIKKARKNFCAAIKECEKYLASLNIDGWKLLEFVETHEPKTTNDKILYHVICCNTFDNTDGSHSFDMNTKMSTLIKKGMSKKGKLHLVTYPLYVYEYEE